MRLLKKKKKEKNMMQLLRGSIELKDADKIPIDLYHEY